jgi:glycine cleavage system H protein
VKIDKDSHYTETHEWVRVEGDLATAGVTDKGEVNPAVESVKAASDCYMPMGGEITEINEELSGSPALVNEEPFGGGWFIQFTPSDLSELDNLMTPEAYQEHVAKEEEGGH